MFKSFEFSNKIARKKRNNANLKLTHRRDLFVDFTRKLCSNSRVEHNEMC